ncbi:retrovirus-related pol polyprotein from transposon TNT 1-94 [Tanacetum coccineum]|uniref:Retrovirus-related pol polyprotein from transposon TNT 1-94 n=1 Tax=Tanacetum coccineum TaxID=301880 RepID=A0ABQ5FF59_9ASTR
MATTSAQHALADAGSETRPPMLERGSYVPWASSFRRYIDKKKEARNFIHRSIDEGPYEMKKIAGTNNQDETTQKEEDLTGDDLKQYEADIEAMNLIVISIPNDIYNSVNACQNTRDMWNRVKRLIQYIYIELSEADMESPAYYVTHPLSVVDYDNDYQGDEICDDQHDSLTIVVMLLARVITQRYYTPINNLLLTSSNTRNQAVVQDNRVSIQSKNVGNGDRFARRTLRTSSSGNASNVQCYNCNAKGHYARECLKPRVRYSKYFMEQMLLSKKDEAGVIPFYEQNDFLLADAAQMEEFEELSVNICMMARIQKADSDSENRPSYDYEFHSEAHTPSTSFMNPLFSKSDHEQNYHVQHEIINSTIGNDQINSGIIFDNPNVKVNDGKVEHDKNAHDAQDNALELSNVRANVCDTEERLEDATKNQIKMNEKLKDLIAIKKKQNFLPIDYGKLNNLYKTFVPQVELSFEQKNFSEASTSTITPTNASKSSSPPPQMPKPSKMLKYFHRLEKEINKLHALLKAKTASKSIFFTNRGDTILSRFCYDEVNPILECLHAVFKVIQKEFPEDVQVMMNVFISMESDFDETLKENKILKD